MNTMNKDEHESWKATGIKKNIVGVFFGERYTAVLGFINVHLVHKSNYAKFIDMILLRVSVYFMNIMNIYEVGLCMAISKMTIVFCEAFMKKKSLKFINLAAHDE